MSKNSVLPPELSTAVAAEGLKQVRLSLPLSFTISAN
jgi:hypothetical protein